ncbi:MAG: hypothetical protein ABI355_05665 [Solirubrobacteraceae bacterium]
MLIQRMLSRPRLTGPLVVIMAVFVTVAAQSAAAPRPMTASTLAFRTVSLSDAFSPGFGQPGSTAVSKIENRRGTLVIGHVQTACVVIKLPDLQCSSTIGLPGGAVQISFHQSLAGRTIVAPVAGGTGRYADVRGDLYLSRVGSGQGVYDAVLHVN